jgi:uncharacterized membrane protein
MCSFVINSSFEFRHSDFMPHPLLFFGRFHPLLVHLPIGFLTLLAAVELAHRFHRFKHVGQARGIILAMTVAASIVTIACGLMLSSGGGYDRSLLFWHKWTGITLGVFIIATAVCFFLGRHKLYTGFLIATFAVMVPASHFGGSMTHGKSYLTAYAPVWLGGPSPVTTVTPAKKITDPSKAILFAAVVQPIFQQNCLACHNGDKTSGQLRLDSYSAILDGGQSGPAVVPADSDDSLIIKRIMLASADSKHMPPDGKPQPTDDQIAALRWWIDSGAPQHKSIAELNPGISQSDLVFRLLKIAPPVDASTPKSLAEIAGQITDAAARTGALIQPVAVDQPWVSINAAVARSFGNAELEALIPLGNNIKILDLAGTKVTDAGLTAIQQMPNLQELRLERTAVTDAGLKNLTKLRKLDYLNLYGTPVTDAGLDTLKGLPALRHLYLWRTKIDTASAQKFAVAKTDQTKIDRLQNQISALNEQIAAQHIDVVGGVAPATKPATMPVMKTAATAAH